MTDTVNISTDPFAKYGWEDHLIQASGLVKMISVAVREMDDTLLQEGLLSISNAIENQIAMAISKVP